MTAYATVVVGGGIIGASVAFHLAHAGLSNVLVCEQDTTPGRGATLRSGGMLRQHHTARADIDLAVPGTRAFRDWAARVGPEPVYTRTGFAMIVGPEYADHLAKNVAAVAEAGGSSVVITPDELCERHPGLRVPEDAAVAYEPDGGYADPALAARSLTAAATRLGVRFAEGVTVTGLDVVRDRVRGVRTNLGTYGAGQVVLCTGAWGGLVPGGLPITTRHSAIAKAGLDAAPGALPVCIDDILGTYFRPAADGTVYFGVSLDQEVDLAAVPPPMPMAAARRARDRLAARVSGVDGAPLVGSRVGFDAYSADMRPVIGPAGPAGLYLCTAFSGGGVKVAPAVGELVAAELTGGGSQPALAPFRPERFAAGAPIEREFSYAHM
jgi:glycine/D-amino acid oxidase-like deaminating enzyme